MIELTGEAYIKMIQGLDSEALLYELIKQTIATHKHMDEVAINGGEHDGDILFRYSAVATEVVQRMDN